MLNSTETSSRGGRRLTRLRSLLYQLALPVALMLVRFWWRTCRVVVVEGENHLTTALTEGPVIPVYWHGRQLFCVYHLLALRTQGLQIGFVISPSVDGEIPARLARRMGAEVIRGSSNQTGARVLRDYYLAVKQGVSPAITPDGPKGPVYSFKQGPVLLSQMTQRPIVPLSFSSLSGFKFRAWDEFWLPMPFSRVAITIGEPTYIGKGASEADVARAQASLETQMMALQSRAHSLLSKKSMP